jgi:acetyl esterase/lipase
MPSLRGHFLNSYARRFIRRRYGSDASALAKQARRRLGSPKLWQWYHARRLRLQPVEEKNFGSEWLETIENNVRGEWLETKKAGRDENTIFYIHGGGYVCCSARTHRPITATLARLSDFRVFSLNYRLAPENPFPAALDDALIAYEWLLRERNISSSKIALAGDSAGGGLVLALLLRLREKGLPLPACAACFSPWTDLAGTGESIRANADRDDFFYPENIPEFAAAYLGEASAEQPEAPPVFDKEDFKNLPPLLFHVGSTEILLSDSTRIYEEITRPYKETEEKKNPNELKIYDDIFHCWQMAVGFLPEARDSLSGAAAFIRRHTA